VLVRGLTGLPPTGCRCVWDEQALARHPSAVLKVGALPAPTHCLQHEQSHEDTNCKDDCRL